MIKRIIVEYEDRIDKYISRNSNISRNDIQLLIEQKQIFVNETLVHKNKFKVFKGSKIEIKKQIQKEIKAKPENIPLNIVFEDQDLIIVNKPSGMVVHPAPGHPGGTLVNALLYHFKNNLSNVNGSFRPGIVHRIDKDTSGLLVVAKNNKMHIYLSNLLKKHSIKRNYLALVEGVLPNKIMHLDLPIGRDVSNRQKMAVTQINSKHAKTHIFVKKQYLNRALVKCELETGRTHQIRTHLSYIKHPVVGDPIYGKKLDKFGQRLHAYELEFQHINGKIMSFKVELPKFFKINLV